MERIGLFNRKEIRAIVKKRKALEYKLRRMKKSKDDVLKYIEYEMNLLELIGKRRKRLMCEDKKDEIDFHIAKRINRLFRGAVSRYSEDTKLWLDQIQFCKKMKWQTMIKLIYIHNYCKFIQKIPVKYVIMAAKYEMEERRLPENARKLFPVEEFYESSFRTFWREYFRMELMYIDWIRKRKAVLEAKSVEEIEIDEDDVVMNGQIAHLVYDSAVEECPDVEYALSFIQICLDFDFGSQHINYILQNVQERFPDKEETLDALAKEPLLNVQEEIKRGKEQGLKKRMVIDGINAEIHSKYEEAIRTLPTEKMWSFYIEFILSLLNSAKENKKETLQDTAVNLMERAHQDDCLALSFYSEWIDLLFERDEDDEALSIALCAAKKWNTVDLWFKCLTFHIQCMQPHEAVYKLLKEAIASVNEKDSVILWKLGVDWLSTCNPERLIEFFESGIKKPKEVSLPLKEMYLEVTALKKTISEARSLYKKFKKMGPLSPQIVKKMIKIEMGQMDPPIEMLRKYYEDGLKEFGTVNIDIWLDYLKLEQEHAHGSLHAYSALCWRAKKTLDQDLLQEFHLRSLDLIPDQQSEDQHSFLMEED
ncbi:hypothetical protein JTE90_023295 [Oedothorax gibbosus]|uniref:U3 small nucleolar RNA-associated protein 6 homolog n=1 Tax=Oedothorax gibbosus TaxID=931172 RepID=A0AAV6UQP9_9ARAC|nr:hypothetical protein JTE90_023295 [Oedothorax gibbosus]